jgi:putative endonuclease
MIARNFRSSQHGGELDIVRWDQDVLCFIEVKTRTKPVLKPAEAAVDPDKRSYCWLPTTSCARYPPSCQWRFDVIAVYYERDRGQPSFELFQNAFSVSYNRRFTNS